MAEQGSVGYGRQGPTDSNDEFNAISFLVQQLVSQLVTSKLVKVVAVHGGAGAIAAAGTVDVLPLVNQIDGAGNPVGHGTVFGIPWSRMQGGKNAVIVDPQVDDIGWVSAMDRDITTIKESWKTGNPGSFRSFDIADGIYAGGGFNITPEQYVAFTETGIRIVDKNGNSVVMDETGLTLTDLTGNVLAMTATGIALTPFAGQKFTVNGDTALLGNLLLSGNIEGNTGGTYAGDLKTSGNVIAGFGGGDQVGLQTHKHTQPNDSHGDSEQPTASPTAGT